MIRRAVKQAGVAYWTASALLLAYLVWNSLYYMPYTVDDAFISFRYARNLVEGHGLCFNPGEFVEGFSNFTWVLLAAVLLKLELPLLTSIKWIGVVNVTLLAIVTFILAWTRCPRKEYGHWCGLLALGLVSTNTSLALWSQAGLETVFFALLVTTTAWRFHVEEERGDAAPLSAVSLALMMMTRPEAPLYGLYFALRRVATAARDRTWRRAGLWLAIAGIPTMVYELWGWAYFGQILPNTFGAKIGGFTEINLHSWFADQRTIWLFLTRQGWGLTGLVLIGLVGCALGWRRFRFGLIWPAGCGIAFVLLAQWDWMPRYRLLVPALPLILILVADGVIEIVERVRRRPVILLFVALVGICTADYVRVQMLGGDIDPSKARPTTYAKAARSWWLSQVPDRMHQRIYPLEGLAQFIVEQVPSGEWIAIRDIGYPGYLSRNPIWDTFGLVTKSAAVARHDLSAAAEDRAYEEMLSKRPALIVLPMGRKNRPQNLQRRFAARLRSDSAVAGAYERIQPSSDFGFRIELVVYRRRDLPALRPVVPAD